MPGCSILAPPPEPLNPTSSLPSYTLHGQDPALARQRGWKGTVILRVEVLADGTAGAVEVLSSSGHEILDEAAAAAVRRWRFEPAKANGVAVASHLEIPIRFELEGRR
jgi:protein TonB